MITRATAKTEQPRYELADLNLRFAPDVSQDESPVVHLVDVLAIHGGQERCGRPLADLGIDRAEDARWAHCDAVGGQGDESPSAEGAVGHVDDRRRVGG